jgi:hypothetical protein
MTKAKSLTATRCKQTKRFWSESEIYFYLPITFENICRSRANANLAISKHAEERAQNFFTAVNPVLPESSFTVERVVAGGFRYPSEG